MGLSLPAFLYQSGTDGLPPSVASGSLPTSGIGDLGVHGKGVLVENAKERAREWRRHEVQRIREETGVDGRRQSRFQIRRLVTQQLDPVQLIHNVLGPHLKSHQQPKQSARR